MAKSKKSKSTEKQARTLAKQGKKAAKGERKATKSRTKGDDSESEDANMDLDAVLAAYAEEQAKFVAVTEERCLPPSPRSSATILASPSNRNELFVFGGEYYDGATARFFNDLFVYLIDRREWRTVRSPNSPLPRSGHAWCRGGNGGGIYLFGGEFSSPKQGTFHHYNDFWYLDPTSREWERLETKKQGPPARSGHRMTFFKNFVILFGGFQDTSQQTRYLQDLWIYDCQKCIWHEIRLVPGSQRPDPRSSFSFLPHHAGATLYGGYSRVKATTSVVRQTKAGEPQRKIMKPVVHQDTWLLHVNVSDAASPVNSVPIVRWERRKKPANAPNPLRAGANMAFHKGRGILFGGVHDVEESEEGIESEFFNTLFAWNIDRNRFFPLSLRRPRNNSRKANAHATRGRTRAKADEEDLLRNLATLEVHELGLSEEPNESDMDMMSVETTGTRNDLNVCYEFPHGRFNAQLTVQDDTLFIFGGTCESGDKEFTFNDMYSIDLVKLDGVRELFFKEPENWISPAEENLGSGDEGDTDESSASDTSDERMSIDDNDNEAEKVEYVSGTTEAVEEAATDTCAMNDSRPFPRPFESLREFFIRTSQDWQAALLTGSDAQGKPVVSEASVKELRKEAFMQAEERWWDCREEVRVLEDEQEDAGIGEIINVADRAATGGRGRR